LSALAGTDGITVEANQIEGTTVINFGADAAGGDVVSLTLVGVAQTDWANINVTVI
jgi:methenyltetrahydromethanopterin cyclohydrolase